MPISSTCFGVFVITPSTYGCQSLPTSESRDVPFDSDDASGATRAEDAVLAFLTELHSHRRNVLPTQLKITRWRAVNFVFGYPTTWDPAAQSRFSDVAKKAGFHAWGEQTFLTSLNEAEASVVQYLFGASRRSLPRPDSNILVADVGGGTADVSIFRLRNLEGLEAKLELVASNRGAYVGSTQIDDSFKDRLKPELLAGYEQKVSEQRTGSSPLNTPYLEDMAKRAILNIDYSEAYIQLKHNYGAEAVGTKLQKQREYGLRFPHPSRQKNEEFILYIDKDVYLQDAFNAQLDKIWERCRSVMERKEVHAVEHVVLAGGLGSSPYIVPKLAEKFKAHEKSKGADVATMAKPQLAVSQGLVRNEQRTIQGLGWVYPAEASYGIRMNGSKARTEWFLRKGKKLKIPHAEKVEFDVRIDQTEPIGLEVVSSGSSAGIAAMNQSALHVKDLSSEMEDYMSRMGQLGPKNRFSKKAKLIFEVCMMRGAMGVTLYCNDMKTRLGPPLLVPEAWYTRPEDKTRRFGPPISEWWRWGVRAARASLTIFSAALAVMMGQEAVGHGEGDEPAVTNEDL